ncbi:DoxX family protein [Luteibacter rhizovicinus DSM 16549]|uniref:DoxX family protein n=1 Tax=Luteibacter rhizovicinus DSM 16549 TaxID=1440763 RepID=A0A0G9HEL3_9GAMM|nr:DoxX family protein [Luteibacter rhizovicinus]APG03177.1 DoxX family protein [Luteibacter rhizovicinus DSM 16549]KLD67609.1 DoxX family protein [Luteibacter rhizovicinus DSM 16549]KLD78977.1 DoxX family protein [Xanthomonas hyacinthi DSM 19077]
MPNISWRDALPFALAAFFVAGSLSNIVAPGSIYEEYLKWGYPPWFHFFTGTMELTTALLLSWKPTRLSGALLGGTVMCAALATVVIRGEYAHAVPPFVAATLSLVVGWISRGRGE